MAGPFLHRVGAYPFVGGGDACGNAQAGLRTERSAEHVEQFGVAIGCLNEELRLTLMLRTLLQLFHALHTLGIVDGQVAIEGKTLTVQSARHHGKYHARGTHQRDYPITPLLGYRHHIGTRVSHSRAPCLADYAYRLSLCQWL